MTGFTGSNDSLTELEQAQIQETARILKIPVHVVVVTMLRDMLHAIPTCALIEVKGLYSAGRDKKMLDELVQRLATVGGEWSLSRGQPLEAVQSIAATTEVGFVHGTWDRETRQVTIQN
jgi:hypothetical protein